MNKYIEEVYNDFIPDNKGYAYIKTEKIFIPIYKVTLSITKRKQTRLNLVEEMVLRIVNCGVTEIDEISGILGLERDILDITIGDLYNKNLAYHASNKCYLMSEGRNILKDLKGSKKEKDSIRNIYVNALNQDIFKEKNSNIVDRCNYDDCKVHHAFEGRNIEFYRNKVGSIKEIFNRENETYSPDSNQIPDELVSIDEIEDIRVCFLKISVNIYVSETGTDLDLITKDSTLNYLLDSIKGDILEQIRKRVLLKNIFTRFPAKDIVTPKGNFEEMDPLKILIKKYVTDKNSTSTNFNLITQKVYSNRILIENEIEKIFKLCLFGSAKITFYVNNLDYWSKNTKFITMLTSISSKTKYDVYYDNVGNINLAEKRIKASIPEITKAEIKQYSHDDWLRIVFEDKFQVICVPQNYKAIDCNTWIIKSKYYFQILKNI